jgi:hypothetical protein
MIEWLYDFIHHKDTFVFSLASASIIIPITKFLANLSAHQVAEKVRKIIEDKN